MSTGIADQCEPLGQGMATDSRANAPEIVQWVFDSVGG